MTSHYIIGNETVINSEYPQKFGDINRYEAMNNVESDRLPGNINMGQVQAFIDSTGELVDSQLRHDVRWAPTNALWQSQSTERADAEIVPYVPQELYGQPSQDLVEDASQLSFNHSTMLNSSVGLASHSHAVGQYYMTEDNGFLPVRDYTKLYLEDEEYAQEEPELFRPRTEQYIIQVPRN